MSRAYNARRKAKRRAQAAEPPRPGPAKLLRRRPIALVPVLLIVVILAVVAVLGLGSSDGISKEQVRQEVTELLDGIPQKGAVLGSHKAPITVWLYADLECPTVRLFVENHLPSFIESWVRSGAARLAYRSLQTDTSDEEVFFEQERAALAAGRQDRMWNFVLTFVRQQGEARTDYVTDEFLAGIASQVPGLGLARWRRDRDDALLTERVALAVYAGRTSGFSSTPSFSIGFTEKKVDRRAERGAIKKKIEASLESDIETLREETRNDFPTIRPVNPNAIGG